MNIQFSSSVIMVNDFDAMKNFYCKGLGLSIKDDFGTCIGFSCGISIWKMSKELPLAKAIDYTFSEKGNNNLEICFETEAYESDVAHIKTFPIKLIHDTQTEPWGQKTIRFYDPENNIVELGESIPTFVKRLYTEGFTADQVAEKTGVPLEQVNVFLSK